MEQAYTPKQDYKVLVRCFTFNQSKYIVDALNGFAMQKTNFPFVCLVQDDCSTDGEKEVIKAWMERECDMARAEHIDLELSNVILVPHKTNENCTFAFYLLKRNLYKEWDKKIELVKTWRDHCEYEALCEGDDYWIAEDKLQMQFDYMQQNEDCSLCCHAHKEQMGDDYNEVHRYNQDNYDCSMADMILIGGSFMATNSMLIRLSNFHDKPDWFHKSPVGDLAMMYLLGSRGKVAYLDKVMSIYRLSTTGSWTERMQSSWSQRNNYFAKDILVHEAFDKWSGFKYHNSIEKKIKNIKRLRLHSNKVQIVNFIKRLFRFNG